MSGFFKSTTPAINTAPETTTTPPVITTPPPSSIPSDVDANGNAITTSTSQVPQNNTVESLVARLTTGGETGIVNPLAPKPPTNPAQPVTTQTTTTQEPADQSAGILAELAKPFAGQQLTANFDIGKISEGIRNGDLTELQTSLETVANAAVERANRIVLTLVPDIIAAAETQILEKVNMGKNVDNLWGRFVAENAGFSANRSLMEPQLLAAVKGGASEEVAFQALNTIYAGLAQTPAEDTTTTLDPRDRGSKTFDLAAFVGK